MDQTYEQALKYMEGTVHELAKHVPKPKRISTKNGFVFRYVEKSIHQAIVQKLARLVSTLYATRHLLNGGFVQEVGALKRILDEIQDDILFLLSGINDLTPLQRKFLGAFFADEFDADTALESTQKRRMVRRCCTARSKSLTSLCRLQSHPAQYVSGIPSAAILLSISHPIRCSTRCLANVRARISGPMIAL